MFIFLITKKHSRIGGIKMTKIRFLRLKPISVQFYNRGDCKPGSQFSSVIEYQNTVYKSGKIKASKESSLSLANIMWMEFSINLADVQNYISIKISTWQSPQNYQQIHSKPGLTFENHKQFVAHLPISELLCVPLNKKKRFLFPILQHAQIAGQAQFKVIFTQSKTKYQASQQKAMLAKDNSYRDEITTSKQFVKQTNIVVKPVLSETSILITPDMFTKKQKESASPTVSSGKQTSVGQGKRYSDKSQEEQNEMGLLEKFEQLNMKFETWREENANNHESGSVWEQENSGQYAQNEDYYMCQQIREESEEQYDSDSG